MAAYQCDNCDRLLLASATFKGWPGQKPSEIYQSFDGAIVSAEEIISWLPLSGETRDFPDVPSHIATAASEAYQCFSIGAVRGALSLSRAVVEATAKEKGIVNGTLHNKIERMVADGHLRPGTGAMAHEVRHWGNDMAHGDFIVPISQGEAEGVLALMGEVLQEVFRGPALLARIQQMRQTAASQQP